MNLRGINFGTVWDASGARNFNGRGWWYHLFLWIFGLRFYGSTFVAKTTTYAAREGNMPLKDDGVTPKELFPKCIYVKKWWKGVALNAIGLSGRGLEFILKRGFWQERTKPFLISFMAVGETLGDRLKEASHCADLLRRYLPGFRTQVGLQINLSCPNVGKKLTPPTNFLQEARFLLDIFGGLNIPLVVKFSVTTSVDLAYEVAKHPACDAICVSNTVPWGALPDRIDWNGIFGTDISPLAKFGGGGLSGKPLLPLVLEWVREAKRMGFPKPINAGGGILCKRDAIALLDAGADSVFLGSIAFLRGWRVAGVIRAVHQYMRRRDAQPQQ